MTKKNSKAHTAELTKLAGALPQMIDALEQEIATVAGRMTTLKKAGIIYASEHWRKDRDGEPKYFYLLYPSKVGEKRRREYVGSEPERIETARAGMARAAEYDSLADRERRLQHRIHSVAHALREAQGALNDKSRRW